MPRFTVVIPDEFQPEDGDAFDALFEALQLSNIPATVTLAGDDDNTQPGDPWPRS
jgi:hypothetical protein